MAGYMMAGVTPPMTQGPFGTYGFLQQPYQPIMHQAFSGPYMAPLPFMLDASEDAPEFDAFTQARILHYFPDTVFPDQDLCPRPPTSPAVIQDLSDKFNYISDRPYSYDEFPITPSKLVEFEIKRCMNRIQNRKKLEKLVNKKFKKPFSKPFKVLFKPQFKSQSKARISKRFKAQAKKQLINKSKKKSMKRPWDSAFPDNLPDDSLKYKMVKNMVTTYAAGQYKLSERLRDAIKVHGQELFNQSCTKKLVWKTGPKPVEEIADDEADAMAERFANGEATDDELLAMAFGYDYYFAPSEE